MAQKHHTHLVEDYVALDIETLDVKPGSPIIELGLVRVRGGKEVQALELYPMGWEMRDVPWGHPTAKNLLAKSNARSKAEQRTIQSCLNLLHEFISTDVIVGQNIAGFDIKRIDLWAELVNLPPLASTHIDMLPLARKTYPQLPNHKLETLTAHHNLGQVEHTALADARQEHLLYELMKADMPPGGFPPAAPRRSSGYPYWRR